MKEERRREESRRSKQRGQKKAERSEKKERNKKMTKLYRWYRGCGQNVEVDHVKLTRGQLLFWWINLPRTALSTQVNKT